MNNEHGNELDLWGDVESGTPVSYPFIYGLDGQGEIHAGGDDRSGGDPSAGAPAGAPAATAAGSPTSPAGQTQRSDPGGSQDSQSVQPGVVSYAIPTPNLAPSQQSTVNSVSESNTSATSSSSSSSNSIVPQTSATPVVTGTPARESPTDTTAHSSILQSFASQTSPPASHTPTLSVSATTSIAFATPTPPPPTPSTTAQAFRHTPAFIVLIILCLLILLGTLFASLSWLFRRKTRKDDENWIGALVYDEPADYGGGGITEHKNVGRGTIELEKGDTTVYPEQRQFGPGEIGDDSGRAGIGANTTRGWSTYNTPVEPGQLDPSTHRQFTHTPVSGYGFTTTPIPNAYTPGSMHGFTPNPDYRRPSLLQRGPPAASDLNESYGLDGGGLTFRRDAGRLEPVTEYTDIITPNPHLPPHPPELAHDSESHYSYALDAAGPFAVTNLLPGDISSSASTASLGGGQVRSLCLPAGRLDDPNPWKRYEGVANRGGVAGSAPETDGGWVGTIRSGLYSAVGRMTGPSARVENASVVEDINHDKFTPVPDPGLRRVREISKSTTHSRLPGRQTRILQRLDSTGTTDADSIASSSQTVYSSDEGLVFSTRATSRRDTVSTWVTTRSRSARGGKREDEDEGGGEGGVSEMKTRVMSTASSDWGSGELAKVLGLKVNKGRK